jgi:hypothetical protein
MSLFRSSIINDGKVISVPLDVDHFWIQTETKTLFVRHCISLFRVPLCQVKAALKLKGQQMDSSYQVLLGLESRAFSTSVFTNSYT